MTRRCSHCSSNGHTTRSCSMRLGAGGGLRLFGVSLMDGSSIKRSASTGNMSHYSAPGDSTEEYHSDDPDHGYGSRRQRERKKGIPWTEEEHRKFLLGLQNLGKGDWRGISKVYVPSRTPSQVASHAQKYFIRQTSANRKGKRSSLFDMVPNIEASSSMPGLSTISPPVAGTDNQKLAPSSAQETTMNTNNSLPSLDLSLKPAAIMPLPFQLKLQDACSLKDDSESTSRQKINGVLSMSQLTLQDTNKVQLQPPALSLALPRNP